MICIYCFGGRFFPRGERGCRIALMCSLRLPRILFPFVCAPFAFSTRDRWPGQNWKGGSNGAVKRDGSAINSRGRVRRLRSANLAAIDCSLVCESAS